MRRFLGGGTGNGNGSTLTVDLGAGSTRPGRDREADAASIASSNGPKTPTDKTTAAGGALSSTKRALQNTLTQLAYSRSLKSSDGSSNTQNAQQQPATTMASNSPLPPALPSKDGHEDENDDEIDDSSWDDALKLPFASSSMYGGIVDDQASREGLEYTNINTSNPSKSESRASTQTISASRPTLPMDGSASSLPFGNGGLEVSASYSANASSLVDLKDEMMLELLSSDALLHVSHFEVLSFDEVEDLRKVRPCGCVIPVHTVAKTRKKYGERSYRSNCNGQADSSTLR